MDSSVVGRLVHSLAKAAAIGGGLALVAVTAVTVVSIVGRILIPVGLRPIPGDFEIVQAGVLFAVFCFLPWCHLERGHAIVAIVTDRAAVTDPLAYLLLSPRVNMRLYRRLLFQPTAFPELLDGKFPPAMDVEP